MFRAVRAIMPGAAPHYRCVQHALMVTMDDARMSYLPRQVAHALSAFFDS